MLANLWPDTEKWASGNHCCTNHEIYIYWCLSPSLFLG